MSRPGPQASRSRSWWKRVILALLYHKKCFQHMAKTYHSTLLSHVFTSSLILLLVLNKHWPKLGRNKKSLKQMKIFNFNEVKKDQMRKFVMISCGAKFKPHPKTSNREKEVQSTKFWCIGQQKEQDNYLFRRHFTTFLCLLLSRNTNDMGILLSNFFFRIHTLLHTNNIDVRIKVKFKSYV